MQRDTVDIYEGKADAWIASRAAPRRVDAAEALRQSALPGLPLVDVGCGPGGHFPVLGPEVVGVDAAAALLRHAADANPGSLVVQADLMALPFRTQSFGGAWARMSYHHVPRADLPLALAHLHLSLTVGAPLTLVSQAGDGEDETGEDDEFPGRFFACWRPDPLTDVLTGAGFDVLDAKEDGDEVVARATRARTLPDTVGPGMRLLVCGLNPSLYAADRGAGFARRTNRFWPAMTAAGLVCLDRAWDPLHLLAHHGIGMTDLVKRATPASADLSAEEYAAGTARVERLVQWLQPKAVVFVGLEGWRSAIDRRAKAGWQPKAFGDTPAYVMPSTSGRVPGGVDAAAAHLREAASAQTSSSGPHRG